MLDALPTALLEILSPGSSPPVAKPAITPRETPANAAPFDGGVDPADWQERPTSSICVGVVGLGPKKRDRLCDEFPTLGDLNAARAQAVKIKKHFADVLPKGIGKPTADELADRLMNAETSAGGMTAAEQAEQTAREDAVKQYAPAAESEPEASDNAEPAGMPRPKKQEDKPKPPSKKSETEKFAQWCRTMVKSLRAAAESDDSAGVLDSQEDSETWDDGKAAFDNGEPFENCPNELTNEYAGDWLRGWLAGELLQEFAEATEDEPETDEEPEVDAVDSDAEAEPEAAAEQKPNPNRTLSKDEFEAAAESIKQSEEFECVSDIASWNAGYMAAMGDKPLESCDYSKPFAFMVEDWIRGYFSGLAIDETSL